MEIGLALSGGGYRATVFHLGVLRRLALDGRLQEVVTISTVSGGSLCVALVFAANAFQWPDDEAYLERVLPKVRGWLTSTNIQRGLIWRALRRPHQLLRTRADDLAHLLQTHFQMTATMQELPDVPRWIINTAGYESGAMFRIEKKRMGDYKTGYVAFPSLRVCEAAAASAGFPVGIGPLEVHPERHQWFRFINQEETEPIPAPADRPLHLWDGGVYDNLGSEPLFEPCLGLQRCDFLVVSDASGQFGAVRYRGFKGLKRLLDVATYQVRALRLRMIAEYFEQHPGTGVVLQIDNTCRHILADTELAAEAEARCARSLSEDDVVRAAHMATHIGRLSQADFDLLLRQGHEVANATLAARHSTAFGWRDYGNTVNP